MFPLALFLFANPVFLPGMTCLVTRTIYSRVLRVGSGEGEHECPKFFRCLGDLGLLHPVPWGVGGAWLILGTWELLVWTWSDIRDICPKLHPRARLIAGDATEPFSPQLGAGAVISLLRSLINQANRLQL